MKNAAAFNADDFRIYSSVLSRQAEAILHRDFDVRGHRSIVNELDDGNLAFTVGRVKLNSVQRAVLHDGHAVFRRMTLRKTAGRRTAWPTGSKTGW